MQRLSFLLLAACAVLFSWWVQKDPGFILIWRSGTSIEMPLWLGLIATLVIGYILFMLLSLSQILKYKNLKYLLKHRVNQERHLYQRYEHGVLQLMQGHWRKAETIFKQVSEKTEKPWLPLLLAGYSAAQKSHSNRVEDTYIRKAAEYLQGDAFVARLMQARLSVDAGRNEEAIAILENLLEQAPKHDFVLRLLLTAYLNLQDWHHIILLLPQIKQSNLYNAEDFTALERKAFIEHMKNLAKLSTLEEGRLLFNKAPKVLVKDSHFIAPFLQILRKNDQHHDAEKIARKHLERTWDPLVVKEYGEILDNTSKQLLIAEEWLEHHGPHPWLYLTLGKLAMREKLWGKAKRYIEQSLSLEATMEAYFNLATVLENVGERLQSLEMCKKGLALALR